MKGGGEDSGKWVFLKEGGGGGGWSRRLRGFSRTKVDKIKPGSETSHLNKCETKSFSSLHPCTLTLFSSRSHSLQSLYVAFFFPARLSPPT